MALGKEEFGGVIRTHYADSTPWWPEKKKAPEQAPNILYILLDDTGYADIGCYGSLIDTPNIDKLAEDGLRYRDFHVNAMCSPTRASLLTGCNHHAAGVGYLGNWDLGFPGYRGCVHPETGMISETLVDNGYQTFCVGKWHLVNDSDMSGAGPFNNWPLGRGFEKFYGFLPAATSQFYPNLVCGNEYVDQPKSPDEGYHFSEDITNRAINYIGDLKSNAPDKPFFCYLAFGAMHSPHQAPKEYIDRYKNKFDEGWDVYRQRVFEKQKELGLLPKGAELTGNDDYVNDWDSFSDSEKRILARYMEVYAGFLAHTDEQIGRLINYLKRIGQYNNTMVVFLADNGASAEGTPWGTKNVLYHYITEKTPGPIAEDELEEIGTENAFANYPTGWAHASNTPFKLYKSWTHNGGIKVPLIITYPDRIKDKGEIRNQYHHVTDIHNTVLETCGIQEPGMIKGVPQGPKHGTSMSYTFENPEAPTRKKAQYYELVGNRGIWSDGWKAVCDHTFNPGFDFSKDIWELYHTDTDFCETKNLADQYPEKLRELIDLWWLEAGKYNVIPMLESHMKRQEGFNSKTLFKFPPVKPKRRRIIYPEFSGSAGAGLPPTSFTLAAYATYKKGDEGVLVAGGDNLGGFALYIQDSRLKFHYNFLGFEHSKLASDVELPEGDLQLGFECKTGDKAESDWRLFINGEYTGSIRFYGPALNSRNMRVGKFSKRSVTGDMKEKKHYPYTNTIDRVEIVSSPPNDEEMNRELKRELKTE
jgi:arylsulfatase